MNDDTLYNRIKNAAQNAESQNFPGMEKVWTRVDEKLHSNVLQNQNSKWKKLAVAASVLLVASLVIIFNTDNNHTKPTNTDEQIVIIDTVSPEKIDTTGRIVLQEKINPIIKNEAPELLKKQLKSVSAVAVQEVITEEITAAEAPVNLLQNSQKKESARKMMLNPNYESRGVQRVADAFISEEQKVVNKANPLLVVDGEAVMEGRSYQKSVNEALKKSDAGDDEIVVLTEPLYIINGTHYSEEEMFGENPTSPYAPLTKQVIETLTILQGEKATSIYGEKGRKGVVLITTKGGKPATANRR